MKPSAVAIRICTALLAALSLALPALSSPEPSRRPTAARTAYERATRMRSTLMSEPDGSRSKADYEKAIREFKAVHFHDPAFFRAPLALEAVGELYVEMGRQFKNDDYYAEAIKAYKYLRKHYPQSPMARDAGFAVAEIYLSNLGRTEEAQKAFEEYLKDYPRSAKAGDARAKLKEIEKSITEAKEAAAKLPNKAAPAAAPTATTSSRAAGLPEVTGIRRWVGPNYTRIVINVDKEVKFESSRVPNPDRIVIDILDSRLSSALVGKTFSVENAFLQQVRIGQFQANVSRVVLDVEKIEEYSIFSLPNPFRLVVDINGPSAPEEKTSTAASKSPKANEGPGPTQTPTVAEVRKPSRPAVPGPEIESTKETKTQPAAKSAEGAAKEAASPAQPEVKEIAKATSPDAPSVKREPTGDSKATPAVPSKAPAPTVSGSRTLTRALGLKIARIVIDPGHGGHDTGTIGPTGLREKDLVLDVGKRLKTLLEEKTGAEVIMTRSDDTFIPLEERTAIANEKGADLFISIHANASRDRRARGIETYYLNFTSDPEALEVAGRENSTSQESVHQLQDLIKKIALSEKIKESQDFATQVQREVHQKMRTLTGEQKNRGVKKAPFVVLIGANMPSVLAEISFLTNPKDEKLLKKNDHRDHIAEALYTGISRYAENLGGVKVTEQASATGARTAPKSNSTGAPNF